MRLTMAGSGGGVGKQLLGGFAGDVSRKKEPSEAARAGGGPYFGRRGASMDARALGPLAGVAPRGPSGAFLGPVGAAHFCPSA